jgi:hypothetical protein
MRINRTASLFLSFALLASVVVGYSTTASAAPATPPAQAVGYWTESAMASAQPVELVVDAKTGQGQLRVVQQGTVTGAATVATGLDWPATATIAQTAVGKVFFSVGRSNYVCSGALVNDNSADRAIVLTAGHCVWNQAKRGTWVSNWAFVPNYDGGNRTKWYASALIARREFTSQTSFNNTALAYDWAFAVLKPGVNNNGISLPDVNFQFATSIIAKNSYDLNISGFSVGSTSFAFGYPAAAPYDGQSLKYASASIFGDPNTSSITWGMNSDLTGGASGGPWLSGLTDGVSDNNQGKLSSVNSYKYTLDTTKMYGPRFTASTQKTFEAALNASGGNQVVTG